MASPPVAFAPHPRQGVTTGTPAGNPAGPQLLPGGIRGPAAFFSSLFFFSGAPQKTHRRPDERPMQRKWRFVAAQNPAVTWCGPCLSIGAGPRLRTVAEHSHHQLTCLSNARETGPLRRSISWLFFKCGPPGRRKKENGGIAARGDDLDHVNKTCGMVGLRFRTLAKREELPKTPISIFYIFLN